jgi:glycine dehydrogenase subunit 1
MEKNKDLPTPHPFMANSAEASFNEMLKVANVTDIDELFEQIPKDHVFKGDWDFDPQIPSEAALYKHLTRILRKNSSAEENLNFLGAGCWQHYVPAICDEMVTRTEFLTPVWGTPSSDHGRNQVWFEFQSQIGELVGMEFVGLPLYSFGTAGGHAIRMAARINKRGKVLVQSSIDPERLAVFKTYCGYPELDGYLEIVMVDTDVDAGAEVIIGVDPISLGVLPSPSEYGADIVVGTTQPLGVHMNAGGGVGGFIATRDDEKYAHEYPTLQVSLTGTSEPGEMAFGLTLFEQSSYGSREHGKDWTGNSVYLWTVANATYMSLLGPNGFAEIGKTILQRSHYAAKKIAEIPGVSVTWPSGFFKEFVVNFDGTKKKVSQINKSLLAKKIFGGKNLSQDFPHLGESALYCVTEIHTLEDLDSLVSALKEVTK